MQPTKWALLITYYYFLEDDTEIIKKGYMGFCLGCLETLRKVSHLLVLQLRNRLNFTSQGLGFAIYR